MKRIICMLLVLTVCIAFVACGKPDTENTNVESSETEQTNVTVEEEQVEEEPAPDYSVIVPEALQGVWGDTSVEGILSLYVFQGNNVATYVVNYGVGASTVLSGTYTVEDAKVKYDFDNATGYSNFVYENDNLVLTNANNTEIKKLSAADIMEYLQQEQASANHKGVICLADIIIEYYPDSNECAVANEKKNETNFAIKAAGEAALANLNTDYDKIQKLTWYEHKNQPRYTDICCYIYPYIGRLDSGNTWLRVKLDYTDAQTDAGWIFYDRVIISVDGENTTKVFSRGEIVRNNDTEVWEIADFEPDASEIQLLKDIANSTETIIRFQGSEYHVDHVVTNNEKTAILDVLAAYDYLANYYEK